MDNFKEVINETNLSLKKYLLSPLTITLGDEFQGVAKNIESAIALLFHIEENIIHKAYGFQLRFVVFEGRIDTLINKEIAYGMLGRRPYAGTRGSESNKNDKFKIFFSLRNKPASAALNNAIMIYQRMVDDWRIGKDYSMVSSFLKIRITKRLPKNWKKRGRRYGKEKKVLK